MPPDENNETEASGPAEDVQETDEARDLLRAIHSSIERFLEGDTQRRGTGAVLPIHIEAEMPDINLRRHGTPDEATFVLAQSLQPQFSDEAALVLAQSLQQQFSDEAALVLAQSIQREFNEVVRAEPPFPAWYASRHTVPDAIPTMRSTHLTGGGASDFEEEQEEETTGPFRQPRAPANPGPVAFGTGIDAVPIWEAHYPEESHMAAVSEDPPEILEEYLNWLHQLDLHTNWIRTSHNNWVVRHALGRVYIKSPTGPFYRLYRPRNGHQCPTAVLHDIARWLLEAAGPDMHHELLEGPIVLETGWFPIGESSGWSFHWDGQSDTMAVLHDNTGLFFYYDEDGNMPPLPFEALDTAMQLHNRVRPREVEDSFGNIYTLRLSFDPPDVLCIPSSDGLSDEVLSEYIMRFRDTLDDLHLGRGPNRVPTINVGFEVKFAEGQSRWTLVDEEHASGE